MAGSNVDILAHGQCTSTPKRPPRLVSVDPTSGLLASGNRKKENDLLFLNGLPWYHRPCVAPCSRWRRYWLDIN